jgi:hypothetical protein
MEKKRIPWNKGKTGIYSEETKKKQSESKKGKKNPFFGKKHTETYKQKMRILTVGKPKSVEARKKMSESKKKSGHKPPSRLGMKGEKCGKTWKGGISNNPYPPAWTKELKQAIRQRDVFVCRVCSAYPSTQVHHIDYDKNNCEPENLITLCKSCHAKTNQKRDYWINYFK